MTALNDERGCGSDHLECGALSPLSPAAEPLSSLGEANFFLPVSLHRSDSMKNGSAERGKWLRHGGKLGQGPAVQIGGFVASLASLTPRPSSGLRQSLVSRADQ